MLPEKLRFEIYIFFNENLENKSYLKNRKLLSRNTSGCTGF